MYNRTKKPYRSSYGTYAVRILICSSSRARINTGSEAVSADSQLSATRNGYEEVVKLLLNNGAELEAKSNDGPTPLLSAASNGHAAIVKLLIDNGAELEAKDYYGWTALSLAANNGHEALVKLLLEKGAKLEAKEVHAGTPLLLAASSGHMAIVKLLIDNGAELEAKSDDGRDPLLSAASNGHREIVKLLLDNGADLEVKDYYGWTPLSLAIRNGHTAVVELLLDKGAQPEAKGDDTTSPECSRCRTPDCIDEECHTRGSLAYIPTSSRLGISSKRSGLLEIDFEGLCQHIDIVADGLGLNVPSTVSQIRTQFLALFLGSYIPRNSAQKLFTRETVLSWYEDLPHSLGHSNILDAAISTLSLVFLGRMHHDGCLLKESNTLCDFVLRQIRNLRPVKGSRTSKDLISLSMVMALYKV
jgi:ankyrin repeat protein